MIKQQLKYEVILTSIDGREFREQEMLQEVYKALQQELGYQVQNIQVKQVGVALRDA